MKYLQGKYILDAEGNPKQIFDVMEWTDWIENRENTKIAFDWFEEPNQLYVSTEFTGIDHNFMNQKPPLLFETRVYNNDGSWENLHREYYSKKEALAGHEEIVKYLMQKEDDQEAQVEEADYVPSTIAEPESDGTTFFEISNFTEKVVQHLPSIPDDPPGNYNLVRRSLLREVFEKIQMAGVDLTDKQLVAGFIANVQQQNPAIAQQFEKYIDVLLTDINSESPLSSKDVTVDDGSKIKFKETDGDQVTQPPQPQALVSLPLSESATQSGKIIKKYAQYYYNLGMNVTCISNIKNEFNSKAGNVYLKAPNHQWEDLWSRRQTPEEFNNYQWSIATGLGLITGFNNLLAIDMDNCSYDFVVQTLEVLGLPSDYEWVVLSGSKQGYHIYVFVNDLLNNFPKIAVVRLFPKELYATLASKVELLIRLHSILPPSVHPTQNKYGFVNYSHPERAPVHIGMDKIQNFINKYFDSAKQENKKTYKKKNASNMNGSLKRAEYQCPDSPHSWRTIIFGCGFCKAEKDRRRAEDARIVFEEREERRINMEQRKQEEWIAYTILEKEIRAMPRYAVWRQDVLARYNWKCAIDNPQCTKDLEVDHFPRSLHSLVSMYGIQKADIKAYECTALWDVTNGQVLCDFHHAQTKSSMYRTSKS